MDCDKFEVVVDLDDLLGGPQPQPPSDPRVRGGVEGLLELDVAVSMKLHLGPGGQLRGRIGEGLEQVTLGLKTLKGPLVSGAVNAVTRSAQDPFDQLTIAVGQSAKHPQRKEAPFDVFNPCLHPAFLFGVSRWAGGDEETITFSGLGIGALYHGVPETGSGNGAFRVVDDGLGWHAAKELKGSAMTPKPGFHLLVADDLGVLMSAPCQRHDKDPRGEDLAG